MASYAIGDLQGCYDEFKQLLKRLKFKEGKDTLWLAGDLVNRGPKSLDTLRYVKDLGDSAITVLGNHDLHLLAKARGVRKCSSSSTLAPILKAKDCDELIEWLRHRPLLHYDKKTHTVMTHAGIYPLWKLSEARRYAKEAEAMIQSKHEVAFYREMYGNTPSIWRDDLVGYDRLRFIINAFTRMRYVDKHAALDMNYSCTPGKQPGHLIPWYQYPTRLKPRVTALFGHWSTVGEIHHPQAVPLDTGCVWGGCLTAVKVGDKARRLIQQPSTTNRLGKTA